MLATLRLARIPPRSSRPALVPVPRRTLFNLGWWSGDGGGGEIKKDEPKVETNNPTPETPEAAASSPTSSSSETPAPPTSPTSPHSSSSSSQPVPPTPTPTPAQTRAEKEARAIRAMLDRDGGAAGFGYEDGAPEGGQRRSVKREMFRLI